MKVFLFSILLIFSSCHNTQKLKNEILSPIMQTKELSNIQIEKDEIFTLLAYALVYTDWQDDDVPRNQRRGYNIGSVLVDKNDMPVYHGLNCINSTDNATQHGEVRAITQYLEKNKGFNLKDFTMYSTLEPCIMCAGMITMTAVKRLVYGQRDVDYSHAFERLAIDTRPVGGFAPYPRRVEVWQSKDEISLLLDDKYKQFLNSDPEKILAKFLSTDEVKDVYKRAKNLFLNYKVKHEENKTLYKSSLNYFEQSTIP